MNNLYIIREALKIDMPKVLKLIQELADFEKEPDAVEVTVDQLERDGFGPSKAFTCFVAETEGDIVGMALVYFRYSTWKGKTVHLEDLIVRNNLRGSGIGSALYTQVIKYAQNQGVKRLEWVVLDWNEDAIKFYERSGANVMRDWYTVQMDQKGMQDYLNEN